MRSIVRRLLALVAVLAPSLAYTQQLRGTIRDSASRQPVTGSVVSTLDAAGRETGRTIVNSRGEYRLQLAPGSVRARVRRLGFRQLIIDIPRPIDEVVQLDIALAALPTLLEPVLSHAAASCSARADRGAAFALLEQARAGLIASIVDRESNPPSVLRLVYERRLEQTPERITRQTVHVDSARRAPVPFGAAHRAPDFARRGFVDDTAGLQRFFGPDADVLLDDHFAEAYCFSIAAAKAGRANQVGLKFDAANQTPGRIDVDGVLWVDTAARSLIDIEYRYRGLGDRIERHDPGGHISFRNTQNGVAVIDRWSIRLIQLEASTVLGVPTMRESSWVSESGGELARAAWSDGSSWTTPLGTLAVSAETKSGSPAAGAVVRLVGTNYIGTADSSGHLEIHNILPGPYTATIVDPRLTELGIKLGTDFEFTAVRDSTVRATMTLPAQNFIADRCRDNQQTPTDNVVIGRVVGPDGKTLGGAKVWFSVVDGTMFEPVLGEPYTTRDDGFFALCSKKLTAGLKIRVSVTHRRLHSEQVVRTIDDTLTIVVVALETP